ncbi:DUF4937 domain-containing protein [Paenibacillus mucilaginosus]|uniref:DUF4937 domain-containing protein n=1 Tax=Paenibacillus mucilaginosus TaxID=61624 RepID=UPI003083D7C0
MRLPAEAEGDSCMLVKLIACRVPERSRTQFAEAQMRWSELKDVEGFILQLGGMGTGEPGDRPDPGPVAGKAGVL